MRSIIVVGGGLIGAAAALRLQAAGMQTTLIDPGDARRGASYGNAGHIGAEQVMPWSLWDNARRAPGSSFAMGGPLDFRWRDAGLLAPWIVRFLRACDASQVERGHQALEALLADTLAAWRRLESDIGAPGLLLRHGHRVAWTTKAAAEAGRDAAERARWGSTSWRDLNGDEIERYAAVMRRPPVAGIHVSGTGQVSDPQGVRDAIMARFAALGGETVHGQASRVESDGRVALATGQQHRADALLIAAGAWSRPLMAQLGVNAPLIGERGYHLHSAETDWPPDLPTTVFEQHFVVISRFASGLRATSCMEFGDPDAPGDPRKWGLLQRRLDELGVRFAATPNRWVGPRPTLPDYVPAIGRLKRAPRILYAFGHAHLGLTEAPITAELVTALAMDRTPAIDLAPFAVERFG